MEMNIIIRNIKEKIFNTTDIKEPMFKYLNKGDTFTHDNNEYKVIEKFYNRINVPYLAIYVKEEV